MISRVILLPIDSISWGMILNETWIGVHESWLVFGKINNNNLSLQDEFLVEIGVADTLSMIGVGRSWGIC